MSKWITIIAWSRAKYLKQVLATLELCPELEEYKILLSLDGGYKPEVADVASEFARKRGKQVNLIPHSYHFGVVKHALNALKIATQFGATDIVYMEDDTLISPDGLEMANWFFANQQPDIICLNYWNGASTYDTPFNKDLIKSKAFNAWIFAITADNFNNQFKDNWNINPLGWDFSLVDQVERSGKFLLQPVLSRSCNIGALDGAHTSPDFHAEFFRYCNESKEYHPEQPWTVLV